MKTQYNRQEEATIKTRYNRRELLACVAGGTAVLAGCLEGDDQTVSIELSNERDSSVAFEFEAYYLNELTLAQNYELDAGEELREEEALAGGDYEIEIDLDDELWTYELGMNSCEHQVLSVVIQDDDVAFDSQDC